MNQIHFERGAIDPSGCISNAWNMAQPKYWMYFGISILSLLMISCIPCLNVFLIGPVLGGIYSVALKDMRGEPVEFSSMFDGFSKFVPLMVIGLIQNIPSIIYQLADIGIRVGGALPSMSSGGTADPNFFQSAGPGIMASGAFLVIILIAFVLLIAFSFAWGISFAFVIPLTMEHDLGPLEAIKLSARAGWANPGGLFVLWLLCAVIGIVGVFALCIGVFFVMPIIYIAAAFAYRQVFPDGETTYGGYYRGSMLGL